jgi:hypothetical protein
MRAGKNNGAIPPRLGRQQDQNNAGRIDGDRGKKGTNEMRNYSIIMIACLVFTSLICCDGKLVFCHDETLSTRLKCDCNNDGVFEDIQFELKHTERKDDGQDELITCFLSQSGRKLVEFVVGGQLEDYDSITLGDVDIHEMAAHHHILIVEILHDIPAARQISSTTIHFFVITADLTIKELEMIEGGYQQAQSQSSGVFETTTVTVVEESVQEKYFLIEHTAIFEEDCVDGCTEEGETTDLIRQYCFGWYTHTRIHSYRLSYQPSDMTLHADEYSQTTEEECCRTVDEE